MIHSLHLNLRYCYDDATQIFPWVPSDIAHYLTDLNLTLTWRKFGVNKVVIKFQSFSYPSFIYFHLNIYFLICKGNVCVCVGGNGLVAKSCPTLAIPWTAAHQSPLSMGLPKQKYWSGLPFPPPIYILYNTHTHTYMHIYILYIYIKSMKNFTSIL